MAEDQRTQDSCWTLYSFYWSTLHLNPNDHLCGKGDRAGNVLAKPTKLSCHTFKFILQYMNCDSRGLQFMIFIDGNVLSYYKTWSFEPDLKTTV